jgi:hypothetical protein
MHLRLRIVRQRLDAFAALQDIHQVRWRRICREQILQLRQKIAVREPTGFE